jgi:ribosomal protein S18 acetylase RimI-like enzyme
MTAHPFDRSRDLAELLWVVGRARASSDPHAFLHPGGLQWLLRRLGGKTFAVRRWMRGGLLAGYAVADTGDVMVLPLGSSLDDYLALIDAEEAQARRVGGTAIEVSAWDEDREMIAALTERGFEASGTYGHELVRELTGPIPPPALPEGFAMRWLEPELDSSYVELHRAAWMRNGVPSTYQREMHDLVVSMPDFRRELVQIVAAPDGRLAAYCIAWFDPRTRTTEIEPLGTHPEFRRLGLGRAVVNGVFRRSAERGASSVMVWGAHGNDVAFHLYESSGMRSMRVEREYRRAF